MQPCNPLIAVLCLVALSAFAASAVIAFMLLRRPKRQAAEHTQTIPPAPVLMPVPEPAAAVPVAILPMKNDAAAALLARR